MTLPVVLITGPVGVGKTTIALEASNLLQEAKMPHAVIDLDTLSWCYPAPDDDYYRTSLALQNLADVWPNYAAAGAQRLILVRVIEARAELEQFRRILPDAEITVV